MKYITFTVPCYNSAAYMRKCIESLLPAGRDAEIIIVDDGSTDDTAAIADAYAEKYPNIIRVIHKENGGHGSGVNCGLEHAHGLYFKVVDSDDWLNEKSLKKLLSMIKFHYLHNNEVDLYLCNYVYEHVTDGSQYTVYYKNVFPQNRIFGWENTQLFRISQFLTMHSMIYRTQLLRDCGLSLPLHTFYVDNVFIMHPLPFVKTMYYINTDLYRYFIGRADQSVNQEVFISRVDQQDKVVRIMIEDFETNRSKISSRKLERYMIRHIAIIVSIVSIFYTMKNTEEALAARHDLWKFIKHCDSDLCKKVRYTTVAGLTDLPGPGGRFIVINGYKITRKIYKFN